MQAMAKARENDDESPKRLDAREERARVNLAKFIADAGYSVTQVADLAGIPQANLARYVSGKSALQIDALQPLADVLGRRSVNDFFDPKPAPQLTGAELEAVQPIFAKSRPGFNPTEEDIADFQEYVAKVKARRAKKAKR